MSYLFVTPTIPMGPAGGHRLFEFYTLDVGVTVVKNNGEFETLLYPDEDFLAVCQKVYMGGHEHIVTDEEATELTNAGFGNYLTEIV
jgi:hypothetical protein